MRCFQRNFFGLKFLTLEETKLRDKEDIYPVGVNDKSILFHSSGINNCFYRELSFKTCEQLYEKNNRDTFSPYPLISYHI